MPEACALWEVEAVSFHKALRLALVVGLATLPGCDASRPASVRVSQDSRVRGVTPPAPVQSRTPPQSPRLAAQAAPGGQAAATQSAPTFPASLSLWFSLNWDSAKQYERFVEVLQYAAKSGVRYMTVSISGNDARVREFVARLLRDLPGVHLTISLSTAELMPQVDGPAETWEQMGRLARWCAEQTGTGRCVIDLEWSLLPWYDGQAGATLDLRAFRRNARALAAAAGPTEILVYPANYRAVEWKRLVTLALLSAEIPRFRQIGTTWHSPHTWRAAPAADIRALDEALSYRPPAEQIILGSTWWNPGALPTVLADIPRNREVWLWFQMPTGTLPTPELVTQTLRAARAATPPPR